MIGLKCNLDKWSGTIQNISFILWAVKRDQMTEADALNYETDQELMQAENKKSTRQMICKVISLFILPFLSMTFIGLVDFNKDLNSLADRILVIL